MAATRERQVIRRPGGDGRLNSLCGSLVTDRTGGAADPTAGAAGRLDERITALLAADQLLTIADRRRYLLIEFHDTFIHPLPLICALEPVGVGLIISHPERRYINRRPELILPWLRHGASF